MVLSEYYLKVIHIQIIKYSEFNKMIPDYSNDDILYIMRWLLNSF